MNQLIQAAIVVVIFLVIVGFILPLLTGALHGIAVIVVVIGAIIGLMKVGGLWF